MRASDWRRGRLRSARRSKRCGGRCSAGRRGDAAESLLQRRLGLARLEPHEALEDGRQVPALAAAPRLLDHDGAARLELPPPPDARRLGARALLFVRLLNEDFC